MGQVETTAKLVAHLLKEHPELSLKDVLGHSDIAPERKVDPQGYPWAKFREFVKQYGGEGVEVGEVGTEKPAGALKTGHAPNIGTFGYAGDLSWDKNSLQGIGAFPHFKDPGSMIDGHSAGLTKEGAERRGLTRHGQEFYGEDGNLSTLRGMGTTGPKYKVATRFRRSGKKKLILLVITDLDPAGDTIAENLVNDFREDYGITHIQPYKVALTIEQVEEFSLAPSMDAKIDSPTYSKYVQRYAEKMMRYDPETGNYVPKAFELDAMDPADAKAVLHSAIRAVMDIDAYNAELAAEEADSAKIIAVRKQAEKFFKSLKVE
jgi:hypothetical protein